MTVQKGGWDYFDEGWTTDPSGKPAANNIISGYVVPGSIITPVENNVLTATAGGHRVNAGANNNVSGVFYSVDPADYATFRTNFIAEAKDMDFMRHDDSKLVLPNAGNDYITKIYVGVVGSAQTAAGHVLSNDVSANTTAHVDTAHLEFDFTGLNATAAVLTLATFLASGSTSSAHRQMGFISVLGRG